MLPYVALHDSMGAVVPGAFALLFDGAGQGRLLLDIAVAPEGSLLGSAIPAGLNAAGSTGSRRARLGADWAEQVRKLVTTSGGALNSDLVSVLVSPPLAAFVDVAPLDAVLLGLGGGVAPISADSNGNGIPDDCE
jgi:hypothetical protein